MALKSIKYYDFEIWYNNQQEFETLFNEVFINQIYHFETDNPKPNIIDCGSHIGLSVLYFKILYPYSSIIAFEPDPESFKILGKNIRTNHLKNIQVYNLALSDKKGKITFYRESSPTWDSCGNTTVREWGDRNGFKKCHVEGVLLSDYILCNIDFLKMDIEGAETNVLKTIQEKMSLIKEIAMEYHIYNDETNNQLRSVLNILNEKHKKIAHSFSPLKSIMPDRYKNWIKKYEPIICNIRSKNVES